MSELVPSALKKRTELSAQSSLRRDFGFQVTPRLPCVMYAMWDMNMISFALFVLVLALASCSLFPGPLQPDASRTRGQVAALFRQLPNARASFHIAIAVIDANAQTQTTNFVPDTSRGPCWSCRASCILHHGAPRSANQKKSKTPPPSLLAEISVDELTWTRHGL